MLAATALCLATFQPAWSAVAFVRFGRTDSQWVVARDQAGLDLLIAEIAGVRGRALVVIQCAEPGWLSFYRDSEIGVSGSACGQATAEEAQNAASTACIGNGGRAGYCNRDLVRFDDGTFLMEAADTNPAEHLAMVAPANAAAQDQRAAIAAGIALADAMSTFCAEKTAGEVGAPVPVIDVYFAEASDRFATRFGVALTTLVDVGMMTAQVRADANGLLANANRDVWPPECDVELAQLQAAARGDFAAWEAPVR